MGTSRLGGIFLFASICLGNAMPAQADSIDTLVQDEIGKFRKEQSIPGISLGLYCKDQTRFYNLGFANKATQEPVTENTIFEIASISKVFASTLLASEVVDNPIRLDEPISSYLLELPKGRDRPIDRVTFKHLATHTSSLPRDGASDRGLTNRELLEELAQWQPSSPIGTQKSYSNYGYGLLGQAVLDAYVRQSRVHVTFEKLLTMKIAEPLGMNDTYVTVPAEKRNRYAQGYGRQGRPVENYFENPVWPGGGGIRSTTSDMMKFLRANLGNSSEPSSKKLVDAMKLAQTPVTVNNEIHSALGWELRKAMQPMAIAKNGSNRGFSSFMIFVPEKQMGIVVLVNRSSTAPAQVANLIIKRLLGLGAC
jgi:beta-lactamase class C